MATLSALNNEPASAVSAAKVDMKLEVVVIPVADVDRSKEFYRNSGGGSTSTSHSTTASGSSSSRQPARRARSSSARKSPRPRPARPRDCT